jgi:hypothetical protein
MCKHLDTIFTFLSPFPSTLLISLLPARPSGQDLFCPPVLRFCRREKIKWKTWNFSLFKIKVATQGVSLWQFHVHMYYNPNWFISSNFLILPNSRSYGSFNQIKISIFILIYRVYQPYSSS